MSALFEQLEARALVAPADRHLARHLLALDRNPPPLLEPLAALTSAQIRNGNVCLPLTENPLLASLQLQPDPEALAASSIVGQPGEHEKPLILDGDRLYLARYHAWERLIILRLLQLLEEKPPQIDVQRLQQGLSEAFGPVDPAATNWQRVAAAVALTTRFCIISGGPGTGKTWTLARILKLLRHQPGGDRLRIGLAAPTGKAAARMTESIVDADPSLLADVDEAQTLHRLLGMRPGRVQPRHGEENPLPLDLLIVDEMSMVDLPMMAQLLAALPAQSRLILLGDRFQLASVEAGQIMADLCGDGVDAFSERAAATISDLSGEQVPVTTGVKPAMLDHIVVLQKSRRFHADRGIGSLAAAVNAGDGDGAIVALQQGGDVHWLPDVQQGLPDLLRAQVLPLFQAIQDASDPIDALQLLGRMRVLCALREGPQGLRQLNALIERLMGVDSAGLYHGQPVMVTVNDYEQQLFNGDTGVVLLDHQRRLRIYFPDGQGGIRTILPARMPAYETVYAMTIHKSQGSEFDEVVIVLPQQESPVVTRELLYTGITRARNGLRLCGSESVIRCAVSQRVQRVSGLYLALWGED